MMLALGASLGLPAQDVLDSVYDESEPLPYEESNQLSLDAQTAPERNLQARPDSVRAFDRGLTKGQRTPAYQHVQPAYSICGSPIIILDHSFRC